jgi:ABC-type lipoprotein export system ATPase subunit
LTLSGVEVRDGARVLLRVDGLDVPAGHLLGLCGPSGAGKSTLLHVMSGLICPDRGAVRWGGADIAGMSEGARDAFRGAHMGLIFQDFMLFEELSALDNAAIAAAWAPAPTRAVIRARAAQVLRDLGIEAPDTPASRLSGGERQRVAAARALAGDPQILLADEPTASLDRAGADRLIADLVRMARAHGRTLICVSHDDHALAAMDEVRVITDGTLGGPA